jgi:hypothetical protein
VKKKIKSLTVYFSSELYSLNHLLGNAYLAEAIYERSHGRYLCLLPQDREPSGLRPRSVRDHDLKLLAGSDLAMFTFDGAEIDPATVVEFMYAKFADIPAVILRSDHRKAGDGPHPWSLMADFYPRTVPVVFDGLAAYQAEMRRRHRRLDEVIRLAGQQSTADAQKMCDQLAAACVRALDRVQTMEPAMPKYLREQVYNWLPLMPGLAGKKKDLRKDFERHLERKVDKGLI